MNQIAKLAETLKKIKQLDRSKMSEDQIASINAILESVGQQVRDRKTGELYDPEVKFKELQNDPKYIEQMKRMAKNGDSKEQDVAEGVAETLPMNDAVKVLRQYGADNFKTTSNELHFYKNGKPFSVDLVMNPDATRSASLSSLNAATRGLKGQGVAEGSTEQVYKVLAVDKSNALSKQVKLKVKASSLDEVFERLAINDWYPLEINGVEVINGKRLKQGVAEAGGRDSWDSNMPGYQGDYGGADNWDSGKKAFKRHEADQEWEREQEYTRQREEEQARIAHYNETGKFWLKYKDSQKHVDTTPYTGKAAANAAALELLKQSPELQGNLLITAKGPAGESVGEDADGELAAAARLKKTVDDVFYNKVDGKETTDEGYTVMPKMDDKYQDRQGLEGPFRTKSGKVVYYDKVEGKYYDPDTDFYIEYDDWKAMNERSISTTDETGFEESLRSRMHKIFSIRDYKG